MTCRKRRETAAERGADLERRLAAPDGPVRPRRRAGSCCSVALFVIGLGPILWLAKSAITPTSDTISHPMALFPHGVAWSNLSRAWNDVEVGRYFWNTVILALGSWCVQIVVATTGEDSALSVLRSPGTGTSSTGCS